MTDTALPKAHAEVTYYAGVSVFSATPAILEWGADDRIRLWTVAQGAAPVLVLDAAIPEITVKGYQAVLNLRVGGRSHRIDFAPTARLAMLGGVAGIAGAQAISNNAGVPQWLEALRGAGAQVRYTRTGRVVALSVGITLGVFVIIGIIVAISVANGG